MPEKTRGRLSLIARSCSSSPRKRPPGGRSASGHGWRAGLPLARPPPRRVPRGHGSKPSRTYTPGTMAVTGAPELLIVMGASATQEQVDEVVARLDEAGCSALVTPGREAT